MPFNNPITLVDKDVSRIPVVLDGLVPTDFVAGTTQEFVYAGKLWLRDDLDSTSASDGITVYVTSDSVRFKCNGLVSPERGFCSVLDFVATAPAMPSTGDVYGVAAAPGAGLFATFGNQIAVCLKGGVSPIWKAFAAPWPGFFVYSQALGSYRSWSGSAWADGLGLVYATGAIPPEALAAPRFTVQAIVTAPPVSPGTGLYWLIGTGATGGFAGFDNRIAKWTGAAWLTFSPASGWKALNLADGKEYTYTSGAWSSAGASLILAYPARVVRGATVALSGSSPGQATAPTNATGALIFPEGGSTAAQYKLKSSTNRLILKLRLDLTSSNAALCFGVFIDGQVTCASNNWRCTNPVGSTAGGASDATDLTLDLEFEIAAGDTTLHTYNFRGYGAGTVQRAYLQFIEVSG